MLVGSMIETITKGSPYTYVAIALAFLHTGLALFQVLKARKARIDAVLFGGVFIVFAVGLYGTVGHLGHVMTDPACHHASAPTLESRLEYLPLAMYPLKTALVLCVYMTALSVAAVQYRLRRDTNA